MIFGGAQVGNIAGPYISGILLDSNGDWANVFYVFGGLGLVWFVFWVSLSLVYFSCNCTISVSLMSFIFS